MNIFYNREGIGDTLIVVLKEIERERRELERKGQVARIFDRETKETVGFNLFNISSEYKMDENGLVEPSEKILDFINSVIQKNEFDNKIEVDLTPKFVVGFVEEKTKHPNADKLSVCKVNVGEESLQIVCGAPNVDKDQKVVVAKVGAVMPSGLIIKEAQLRGVDSFGMICSAKELNLPDAPKEKGILVLSDEYKIGQPYAF